MTHKTSYTARDGLTVSVGDLCKWQYDYSENHVVYLVTKITKGTFNKRWKVEVISTRTNNASTYMASEFYNNFTKVSE